MAAALAGLLDANDVDGLGVEPAVEDNVFEWVGVVCVARPCRQGEGANVVCGALERERPSWSTRPAQRDVRGGGRR